MYTCGQERHDNFFNFHFFSLAACRSVQVGRVSINIGLPRAPVRAHTEKRALKKFGTWWRGVPTGNILPLNFLFIFFPYRWPRYFLVTRFPHRLSCIFYGTLFFSQNTFFAFFLTCYYRRNLSSCYRTSCGCGGTLESGSECMFALPPTDVVRFFSFFFSCQTLSVPVAFVGVRGSIADMKALGNVISCG